MQSKKKGTINMNITLPIPAALLESRISESPRSPHPIIAVCSIGQRSALAAATLRSLGFPTATHLANGLDSLP
jgi:rhodanese-related sulfurtransferase